MKQIKNKIEEFGIIKIVIYIVLALNAIAVSFSVCHTMLLYFDGDSAYKQTLFFQNLHLVANSHDTFMDFFNSIQYGKRPYTRGVIYPPLANVMFAFFGNIIPHSIRDYMGTLLWRFTSWGIISFSLYSLMTAFVCAVAISTVKYLTIKEKWYLSVMLLFTEPFLFCLERGNCVVLAVAFTLIFINNYDSENKTWRIISIVSLAIAAGIKIYPAIFGFLLIRHKKWKMVGITIATGIAFMFLPMLLFDADNRNVTLWINNIINCSNEFKNIGYGFKLNLSNTLSALSDLTNINFESFSTYLSIIILLLNCVIVIFSKKIEEWQAITLLSLIVILIPSFSWTYTMLFILLPLFKFLSTRHFNQYIYIYITLFVLCLIVVPFADQFGCFMEINRSFKYPLGWTTVIESVSLLLLELTIISSVLFKKQS